MGGDNAVPIYISSDLILQFQRELSYLTSGTAVEAGRVLTRAPKSLALVIIIASVVH